MTTKPIVTRKEAIARGATKYYTGEPCGPRGHLSERRTSSSACVACDLEKKSMNRIHENARRGGEKIPGARFVAGYAQSGSK